MVGITDLNDKNILENTGDLYDEIATNYPTQNYTQLCNQFDVRFAQSQSILNRHLLDSKKAVKEVLNIWEGKGNATRAKLESALKKAETGALCTIVAKHFANVEVHEEGEEADESDEDEVRVEEEESDEDEVHEEGEESDEDESEEEEEEDSDEEPATVHQRGGAQTINASGRSKVKGSTMTGPVTNMNIHNRPAEGSTSQRQGRKGNAAGSSGGKKMSAGPSGSRPKRKRKPATVRQSGGDQTINASGRSRVEGSTMTIHNPPPEPSTSQRQRRKRKADGSSGGKKRAKNGR